MERPQLQSNKIISKLVSTNRMSDSLFAASLTVIMIASMILVMSGCTQSKEASQRPRRLPARIQLRATANAAALDTNRSHFRPTSFPPTRMAPALSLLGTWETLEGTGFDVVLAGADAGEVAGVSISGNECVYQSQKSTLTVRMFRCIGPLLDAGVDEKTEFAKVTYNTGAPATSAGGFVFRSVGSWRQYNGEYYMESLWNYVINASVTQGPKINLEPRALPGYIGDPTLADQAALFNAVRLWGASGPIICPSVGHFEYQCPVVPERTYSFDILFEQGTRYLVSNTFFVKVVYGALDAPAPEVGNGQTSSGFIVTAPQCDPAIIKGC